MPAEILPQAQDTPMPPGFTDPAFDKSMDTLFAGLPSDKHDEPAKPDTAPPPAAKEPPQPAKESADVDVPADLSPAAKTNFKKALDLAKEKLAKERDEIRTERDRLKTDFDKLKTDFETAQKARPNTKVDELPEYKALKSEYDRINQANEEYSKRLQLLDVTQHPKFVEYFENKTNAALAMAKNAGGEKALEILKLPKSEYRDQQFEMLVSELGTVKGTALVNAAFALEGIEAERNSEIAKAQASYKTIQEQRQLQAQKEREAFSSTFASVRGEVTNPKDGLAVFQERAGDEEWNKGVRESLALAQSIYEGEMPAEDRARAAFWSASAPRLLASLKAVETRNAELEAEIKSLRGAAPGAGSGSPESTDTPPPATGMQAWADHAASMIPGLR